MLGNFKLKDWGVKHIVETITAIWDFTAGLTVTKNDIKAISTDGIVLKNDTVSDGTNTVQKSPRIRLRGNVRDTDGGVNKTSDWTIENVPVTGNDPYGVLAIGHSLDGAAYSNIFSLYPGNAIYFASIAASLKLGNLQIDTNAQGGPTFSGIGQNHMYFSLHNPVATSGQRIFSFLNYEGNFRLHSRNDANDAMVADNIFVVTYNGKVGVGKIPTTEKFEVVGAMQSVYISDADSDTGDVLSTGITAKAGTVIIRESTGLVAAKFFIEPDNTLVKEQGDAVFTVTKDTGSSFNFYYESDQFKLQNLVGDNKGLYVGLYTV